VTHLHGVWVVGAVLTLFGCGYPRAGAAPGPVLPAQVERARAKWPDANEASLEQGRQLFVANCSKCHSLPDRNAVAPEKWPRTVERMGAKAALSREETQLVFRFIEATRAP